ncbi:MAG: hypothetical protein OMM_06147 [Candidatus Magnetoglobus multicellularis str. Araruama]|uniref:Uncharacterized protein n=1 Tax=Candidatus Magnetoglobus multicellularis str. Araruama TaxID=890399 RepID=A0A1V1NR15_9BACT|nr:MAG: hypothetical protein OMM_06147 [Candidatus Magnetoglobus multicellularis str. Araruama]
MTLNDRGKDLTILEKSKSLLMEYDENYPSLGGPNPHSINKSYGNSYQSIDKKNSYLDDNSFIQQVGMSLWESTAETVHLESAARIYERLFHGIPRSGAGNTVHSEILPAINQVTKQHDNIVDKIDLAIKGSLIGHGSFISKWLWVSNPV